MDAVFAFAHGLHDMCRQNWSACLDDNKESFDRDELLQHLLNTSFDSLANGRVKFMPNGDSSGRYSIHYLQKVGDDFKFIPVGSWSDADRINGVITTKVPWYLEVDESTGTPRSVCSLPCELGEKRLINPDNPCCWSCIKCKSSEIVMHNITECVSCIDEENGIYRMPNENFTECVDIEVRLNYDWAGVIITLSTFGLLFAIVVTSFYVYHREKPLIKASSRELSYVMFVGK